MAVLAGHYGPVGYEYPNGQHAANVPYAVTTSLGVNITLYTNKNKTVTKPNPNTTDELGNIAFFATPGEYRLIVNSGDPIQIVVPLHPDEVISGGGGPGGPVSYEHEQTIPSIQFDVTHNLGFDPAGVVCIRESGGRVYPGIAYVDPDTTVRLSFPSNFTGTVFLS